MAVDERRRSGLFERLAATLGPDEATTMFDLLPPAGAELALRSDIADLDARIDRRFEQVGSSAGSTTSIDGSRRSIDGSTPSTAGSASSMTASISWSVASSRRSGSAGRSWWPTSVEN
jgi:hypothetical protein